MGYKAFHLSFFKVALAIREGESDFVRMTHPHLLAGEDQRNLTDNKVHAVQNWSPIVRKQGDYEKSLFKIEGSIQFSKMEVHAEEKQEDGVKQWEPYQEKKKAKWKAVYPKKGKSFSWDMNDSNWFGSDIERTF